MHNWVNRYACFRSVFLCLLYIAASCENASQFDRANDRYGANSTHNSHRNRLVRLLTMPNCFDKQAARHSYTYTHHVANLFQNIYTPTFPSSICVCSLSCILINHFPLYTPAHTHARYAIPFFLLPLVLLIQLAIVSMDIHTYIDIHI